jgi:hypothetical protein
MSSYDEDRYSSEREVSELERWSKDREQARLLEGYREAGEEEIHNGDTTVVIKIAAEVSLARKEDSAQKPPRTSRLVMGSRYAS